MLRRLLPVALLLLVAGCAGEPAAPFRVGLLVWPPYELPRIAQELGPVASPEVEFVDFMSPVEAVRAYRNGRLDALPLTAQYLLALEAQEPGQHCAVLLIDESRGGDALIARPGIEELAGLRGRRVGAEASELGAYIVGRALEQAGLGLQDVERVAVDFGEQAEAWLQGRLDAVVTYEPVRSQLLAAGGSELFNSSDLGGEILDLLITRRAFASAKDPRLQRAVELWFEGLVHLREQPGRSLEIGARRGGLLPGEFADALRTAKLFGREENRALLSGRDPWLADQLDAIAARMLGLGMLSELPSLDGLLDPAFVPGPGP